MIDFGMVSFVDKSGLILQDPILGVTEAFLADKDPNKVTRLCLKAAI